MDDIAIVITGDAPIDGRALAAIPDGSIVIAADGALDHALGAGLQPAALVGDLDSVSDQALRWAEEHATIERHPPDKDHTDTELALATAADLDPERLILVSGGGDRLDHTMAAVCALGHPSLTSVPSIEGWWGSQQLAVVHGPGRARLELPPGTTMSVLALQGPCGGVSIGGVQWPLAAAELVPAVGLGVSNVTTGDDVEISLTSGVLTVFVNSHLEPHPPTESEPS